MSFAMPTVRTSATPSVIGAHAPDRSLPSQIAAPPGGAVAGGAAGASVGAGVTTGPLVVGPGGFAGSTTSVASSGAGAPTKTSTGSFTSSSFLGGSSVSLRGTKM